jgi:signal peptidase II
MLSAVVLVVCVVFVSRRHFWLDTSYSKLTFGLLLGGTLGNLIDRLVSGFGGVTDFISIGIWPAFNLADSAIVIGIFLFAVHFYYLARTGQL